MADFYADAKNQLGSGPFQIKATEPTSFTSFVLNKDYNGPLHPKIDSMQWNVSVDAAARTRLVVGSWPRCRTDRGRDGTGTSSRPPVPRSGTRSSRAADTASASSSPNGRARPSR